MAIFGTRNLPHDNPLNRVYRFSAGVIGAGLLVFGVLGFADALGFFDTRGDQLAGLSTNTLLSAISVLVGLIPSPAPSSAETSPPSSTRSSGCCSCCPGS